MAAYAALLSLTHIIHDLQNHPFPPISIDPQQLQSLSQILAFLLEFLENLKSPVADDDDEADPFEMRIVDAAYAAEDVIESHIVYCRLYDQDETVDDQDETDDSEDETDKDVIEPTCIKFYQDLQHVIEVMDLIKQTAVEMNTERAVAVRTRNSSVSAVPLRSASASSSSTAMVCSDAVLHGLMYKRWVGSWIVEDSSVLPRLERLVLYEVGELEEFPIEIGNITTLQKIELRYLDEAVFRSAREMVEEQVDAQGDQLPFHVHVSVYADDKETLPMLSNPNFTLVDYD